MPFQSKAQMRAAFGGYLGSEMKDRAETWAHETPDIKALPQHADGRSQDAARALLAKNHKHERAESPAKERAEEAATRGMR